MTAATATLAKRRTAYLDNLADSALREEDEAVTRRQEAAEVERAAEKRRLEMSRRRDVLVQERLEALTEAETAGRKMVAAMHKVRSFGGELATIYVALGDQCPPGLAGESAMRSLGDKLSATLRPLANNGGRFGGVTLARTWRQPDQPWAEDAIARVGRTEKENGNG